MNEVLITIRGKRTGYLFTFYVNGWVKSDDPNDTISRYKLNHEGCLMFESIETGWTLWGGELIEKFHTYSKEMGDKILSAWAERELL